MTGASAGLRASMTGQCPGQRIGNASAARVAYSDGNGAQVQALMGGP